MKKIAFLLVVLGVLAGCNTMEGLGKDIQQGGQKLEKSAK
ncbi:MAG: entericidin A/B family lipoprotein [Nitrosomonadales bacterium]|nr:entericidin A/B family lipoprotein [Nitrosomonadales bacterium]